MNARTEDFDVAVAAVGVAAGDFVGGDPTPYRTRWARRADVTIFGGWGAYERGWDEVGPRLDRAAARFDSGAMSQEVLASGCSGDIGYTVSIERGHTRLAGETSAAPMVLRVTHMYRRIDGIWNVVHRHADPITEKTAPAAVLASGDAS